MGVDEENPPDEENYKHFKKEWREPVGRELLSIMWPWDTLPSLALKEVFDYDVADSMADLLKTVTTAHAYILSQTPTLLSSIRLIISSVVRYPKLMARITSSWSKSETCGDDREKRCGRGA